jgi:hypothetical protein
MTQATAKALSGEELAVLVAVAAGGAYLLWRSYQPTGDDTKPQSLGTAVGGAIVDTTKKVVSGAADIANTIVFRPFLAPLGELPAAAYDYFSPSVQLVAAQADTYILAPASNALEWIAELPGTLYNAGAFVIENSPLGRIFDLIGDALSGKTQNAVVSPGGGFTGGGRNNTGRPFVAM